MRVDINRFRISSMAVTRLVEICFVDVLGVFVCSKNNMRKYGCSKHKDDIRYVLTFLCKSGCFDIIILTYSLSENLA